MKLLIIEDSESYTNILLEYLSPEMDKSIFDIESVTNLSDAKKKLQNGSYQVILLDLNLPDSTGMDTVESIMTFKNNQFNKTSKIIVITDYQDWVMAKKIIKLGVSNFLLKSNADEEDIQRAVKYATYTDIVKNIPRKKKSSKMVS